LPFYASALVTFESFSSAVILNSSCVPVISYSVTITPSTITAGNVFVFALDKLDEQGVSVQSQDFSINIPANGIVEDESIVATGFTGLVNYKTRVIENTSNEAFVGQTNSITAMATSGTCVQPNGTAETNNPTPTYFGSLGKMDVPIENPISINSIPTLIQKILEGMIKIGIPLLVVMIVYSGALYLFARGNQNKVSEAHTMLLYTLIGGAILLGAWAIAQMIHSTLIDLTASLIQFFV